MSVGQGGKQNEWGRKREEVEKLVSYSGEQDLGEAAIDRTHEEKE